MRREQEQAFEAFVSSDGPQLLRAAFLLTGDRGHAEDLFQTTLERVARHWTRLDGAPAAYARTVLVHASRDRWRRRAARVTEASESLLGPGSPSDDHASEVALRASLVPALQRLSSRQRSVVVLRHLLDLSEADTAAALGISVGTVKSTASTAAARLRGLLPDLDPSRSSR